MVDNPKVVDARRRRPAHHRRGERARCLEHLAQHPERRRDRRRRLRRARRCQHARPVLQPRGARGRGRRHRVGHRLGVAHRALEKVVAVRAARASRSRPSEPRRGPSSSSRGSGEPAPTSRRSTRRRRCRALELWTGWVNDGLAPNSVHLQHAGHQLGRVHDRRVRLRRERIVVQGCRRRGGLPVDPGSRHRRRSRSRSDRWRVHLHPGAEGHLALRHLGEDRRVPDATAAPARPRSATSRRPPTVSTPSSPTTRRWSSGPAPSATRSRARPTTSARDYPIISEQLYTAVQNALSGAATPADALKDAQAAAAEGTK